LKEKKLTAKGIYGIFPANQVNDDDINSPSPEVASKQVFLTLRQCSKEGAPNIALSDYSPKDSERQIIWVLLCNYFRC
jgi:5-methyltetrahydrofolate--homocysteine methyltransferase